MSSSDSEEGSETKDVRSTERSSGGASVEAVVEALQDLGKLLLDYEARQEQRDMIAAVATDVSAAVRAVTAPRSRALAEDTTERETSTSTNGKDCPGCECVAEGCCCFEIVMDSVRVITFQLEPADVGPTVGFTNALELSIFGSITVDGNKTGAVWPGFTSFIGVTKRGVDVGRTIGRVCLADDATKSVAVEFEVTEHDANLERPIGMKDEYGSTTATIVLNCCSDDIYPSQPATVLLDFGGTGGGKTAEVEIIFSAHRVC